MGNVLGEVRDFEWEYTDQPHASRRLRILRKYPEVKRYMRPNGDPRQAVIAIFVCLLHLCFGLYVATHMVYMRVILAVVFGQWLSSFLLITLHETAHNQIFGTSHPRRNKAFGIFVNMFVGVPFFSVFKKHHLNHHKYQGDCIKDVEYPTQFEQRIFNRSPITKFFWQMLCSPITYVRSKFIGDEAKDSHRTIEETLTLVTVVASDAFLIYIGLYKVVLYQFLTVLVASGVGLTGVWGLTAHTVYFPKEDTMNYYGWMNRWFMNIGYHMEHHDFPNVPQRFLPEIRKIAPEFYQDHHQLDSFATAALTFYHSERIGIHSRVKRAKDNMQKEKSL